jgi:hypothetical protein
MESRVKRKPWEAGVGAPDSSDQGEIIGLMQRGKRVNFRAV